MLAGTELVGLEDYIGNRNTYTNFYSTCINFYSFLIFLTGVSTTYHLMLFHFFHFFGFCQHCHTNAMMTSSTVKCSAIHILSCIAKCHQALSNAMNIKSTTVLKKKPSGTSKHSKNGGGGLKPPPGVIPLPLCILHPQKWTQEPIKVGCCFFCVFHLLF